MNNQNYGRRIRRLFGTVRPGFGHVPGIAALASVLTTAGLLWVLPGTVTSWSITSDMAPLVAAGGTPQPVVGFVQSGVVRVYVPLLSILLVLGGELAAVFLSRWGLLVAIAAGASAGGQLLVISGCGCGDGTAGTTITLLEQATRVL